MVTRGMASCPVVVKELISKGAAFTSSYEEELEAATFAVQWNREQNQDASCLIVLATENMFL